MSYRLNVNTLLCAPGNQKIHATCFIVKYNVLWWSETNPAVPPESAICLFVWFQEKLTKLISDWEHHRKLELKEAPEIFWRKGTNPWQLYFMPDTVQAQDTRNFIATRLSRDAEHYQFLSKMRELHTGLRPDTQLIVCLWLESKPGILHLWTPQSLLSPGLLFSSPWHSGDKWKRNAYVPWKSYGCFAVVVLWSECLSPKADILKS